MYGQAVGPSTEKSGLFCVRCKPLRHVIYLPELLGAQLLTFLACLPRAFLCSCRSSLDATVTHWAFRARLSRAPSRDRRALKKKGASGVCPSDCCCDTVVTEKQSTKIFGAVGSCYIEGSKGTKAELLELRVSPTTFKNALLYMTAE